MLWSELTWTELPLADVRLQIEMPVVAGASHNRLDQVVTGLPVRLLLVGLHRACSQLHPVFALNHPVHVLVPEQVQLCDRLQMGVRMVGYQRMGVRGLEPFAATIQALDCSEFSPTENLRTEILAAL